MSFSFIYLTCSLDADYGVLHESIIWRDCSDIWRGKCCLHDMKCISIKKRVKTRSSISGEGGVLSSSTYGCINFNRPFAHEVRRHPTVFIFHCTFKRLLFDLICLWMKCNVILICIFSDQYVTCLIVHCGLNTMHVIWKMNSPFVQNYLYSKKWNKNETLIT